MGRWIDGIWIDKYIDIYEYAYANIDTEVDTEKGIEVVT